MPPSVPTAAQLTLGGLALVLISCVLLVGLIRVLVALGGHTAGHRPEAAQAARERAAAAAVAVALAMHHARPLSQARARPHTSPWQEVMRAAQLRARSRRQ